MSYQNERAAFIAAASKEGLDLDTITKLLRYASTLQRLAVAQCNGDYPYNGDRDRPSAKQGKLPCPYCSAGNEPKTPACACDERGMITVWQRDLDADRRHDARYTVCPKCETSGVRKSAMVKSSDKDVCTTSGKTQSKGLRVCPDCRTQELVKALLDKCPHDSKSMFPVPCTCAIKPVFGGDPRGAVLRLSTPARPYDDHGRNGAYGLYVPARER